MNSTRQKIALYTTVIIGFAGTANAMYRPAINRLSAPLITSARSIRSSTGYMPKNCNINQSQRSFSFGNRQLPFKSSGRPSNMF